MNTLNCKGLCCRRKKQSSTVIRTSNRKCMSLKRTPCGGLHLMFVPTVRNIIMARFYLCENHRMRCKLIRQSSLRLRATGGVVPPSVSYLPCLCELGSPTYFPYKIKQKIILIYACCLIVSQSHRLPLQCQAAE
jgi:hypothetical protein